MESDGKILYEVTGTLRRDEEFFAENEEEAIELFINHFDDVDEFDDISVREVSRSLFRVSFTDSNGVKKGFDYTCYERSISRERLNKLVEKWCDSKEFTNVTYTFIKYVR